MPFDGIFSPEARVLAVALELIGPNGENWTRSMKPWRGTSLVAALNIARRQTGISGDRADIIIGRVLQSCRLKMELYEFSGLACTDFDQVKPVLQCAFSGAQRERFDLPPLIDMQIAALQKLLQEDGYNAADIDECVADYRAHFERPRCKPPNISIEAKPS
jgi:hypothetical protein